MNEPSTKVVSVPEKEQELYEKLVEKTKEGKLKWKMHDPESYFIDFGGDMCCPPCKYHVCVMRSPEGLMTMTVRFNDEYLTGISNKNQELFRLAENSCEQRQKVLAEALAALEAL